jgi:hypothetical protein
MTKSTNYQFGNLTTLGLSKPAACQLDKSASSDLFVNWLVIGARMISG